MEEQAFNSWLEEMYRLREGPGVAAALEHCRQAQKTSFDGRLSYFEAVWLHVLDRHSEALQVLKDDSVRSSIREGDIRAGWLGLRSQVLLALERPDEAFVAARDGYSEHPTVEGGVQLASVLRALGDPAAETVTDDMIGIESEHPAALCLKAELRLDRGDLEAAWAWMAKAFQVLPTVDSALFLARVALAREDRGEAIRLLRWAREQRFAPEVEHRLDLEACMLLVQALHQEGEATAALQAARDAARDWPDDPRIAVLEADQLRASGDLGAAIASAERAVSVGPSRIETWLALGDALVGAGRDAALSDLLARAASRLPSAALEDLRAAKLRWNDGKLSER